MQSRSTGSGEAPLRVGIVGGSGYAGVELLRLLSGHPKVEVVWVHSRSHPGEAVGDHYPSLSGVVSLRYATGPLEELASQAQAALLAAPARVAAELAPVLVEAGLAVVDLSADFRLRRGELYETVYGFTHPSPQLLERAAYGIPELFADQIRASRLVANPGCYPTAALLAVAPLLAEGLHDPTRPLSVVATSGISGAGSQPGPAYHFPHAAENVRPYGLPRHRHVPEMEQALGWLAPAGTPPPPVVFVPHLVPASRGILATCLVPLRRAVPEQELVELYRERYRSAPFVRVLTPPRLPETKAVYGSNFCDLAVRWDPATGQAIAIAAIDNLVKGASGQAVQNLNLMMGWDQRLGLGQPPVYP